MNITMNGIAIGNVMKIEIVGPHDDDTFVLSNQFGDRWTVVEYDNTEGSYNHLVDGDPKSPESFWVPLATALELVRQRQLQIIS